MRTRTTAAAALIAAGLLLTVTACGTEPEPDAPAAGPKPTKSAPLPSPTPTPTEDAPLAFGETVTVRNKDEGTEATVAVVSYKQGIKAEVAADEEFGTDGYVWATLELKLCSTKGTSGATRYPWALAYSDGARIEPSGVTYGDFPKPEYPYEAMVKQGDCIRGKTMFAVPGDQRPERVLYTTELFDTPPEWSVPKS
ncbi:hypothetical protein [Streptomyces sp. DH8]|uniref:hypothetical protein n=1 Tax=Streptomyces sp. DH8 TaxID=2857008 RepID=UPI001E29D5DC|nr:hypothetical protein [Streptomyces sp. DH8]